MMGRLASGVVLTATALMLAACAGAGGGLAGSADVVGSVGGSAAVVGSDVGAYTVECRRRIAGAERSVRLSVEGVVSCEHHLREDPADGDGMADSLDSYTFTAVAPGEVDVVVVDDMPWMESEAIEDFFRLVVDDNLQVTRVELPEVERFELRVQGDAAGYDVLAAEPGDAGFLELQSYQEEFDGTRHNDRSLLVRPDEVTVAFIECGAFAWNGFSGSNSDVLDGASFTFEATLSDGSTISASGTNSFPEGYGQFRQRISAFLGL